MARLETVRIIVAMATWEGWSLHQLDVKSAFLNGYLEEEIYVTQPLGFTFKGEEHKVYRLNKELYGLKQAPRAWNHQINQFLEKIGFVRYVSEQGVHTKCWKDQDREEKRIACLYVDDMLLTGSKPEAIAEFKSQMHSEFEMSDLGRLRH